MNSEKQETGSFTDSRDGKTYKTVKIGNQTWMAENLAYKAESDCWAYNNDEKNVATYGYLYDWETAIKVCPKGWHLPRKNEWQILIEYLGGSSVAGGKLKSTSGWNRPNEESTNSSGFSALPSGSRDYDDGTFNNQGNDGGWWSATEDTVAGSVFCYLNYIYPGAILLSHFKQGGFSVRCLKDDVFDTNSKNEETINKKIPNSFIDSRDGKTYKTVKMGNQTWMAENLAYKANNGCWTYDNDESNIATYGYLYDWETAKQICPKGWHLPSKNEWEILIDYLGGKDVAGGKLKSINGWNSPNEGGTNSSGYSALPGGGRDYGSGTFLSKGGHGGWWSATEGKATYVWLCLLGSKGPIASLSCINEQNGFSVRCVKDSEIEMPLTNKVRQDILDSLET